VQGAIGGLAFAMLGLGAPIFWGVIMAFFSLLPLGAWIVWFPASIWLLLTDQMARGIALMVIGAGGISLIDNFLRPWLLAGRTEMNGLLVFISLLGGISAFGLVGLVLGPVIMATAISFVDAYATDRREVTDTMTFPQRAIGAARLEVPVFEEIEADRQATSQALLVVVLSSMAAGIGLTTNYYNAPSSIVSCSRCCCGCSGPYRHMCWRVPDA
jgi:hypothetical protein